MAGYTIRWLGWYQSGGSDKIWGWLRMDDGRHFAFWGRRKKSIRFKQHRCWQDIVKLQCQKQDKGYSYVPADRYTEILGEEFETELEINCMTAILTESVM